MSALTVSKEEMMLLLNEWYQEIREQNIQKSSQLKDEISRKIQLMEIDPTQTLFIYYSLLELRQQLLVDHLKQADKAIQRINTIDQPTDDFLAYYYHFFKAQHFTIIGSYSDACIHFEKAEALLALVPDEVEKAEFHYKVANYYYHVRQPVLAIHYAKKAKEFFEGQFGYDLNVAACQNVLGLAYTLLKQFKEAEVNFLSALNTVQKMNQEQRAVLIRYNLGLLYSEQQNQSEAAISFLEKVYEKRFKLHKTAFLLAREYYKTNKKDAASHFIEEGLKHCRAANNEEYRFHFHILAAFHYAHQDDLELESAIKEGISYFEREELWGYVQDYSEQLAEHFYTKGNYEKSSDYFHLAFVAKQKLLEKGVVG